jgi:outer membrane biosynthesis protein TonB
MTKFLLILLLIAVIAVIGWLAARSRADSAGVLPADDRPDAVGPGTAHETAIAPPEADISAAAAGAGPFSHEPPQTEVEHEPVPEPEVVAETVPPMEPDPIVEPLPEPDPVVEPEPPTEPEPIIEPEPEPVEPEPVIEPDTAVVGSPHGDPLATEADQTPPVDASTAAGNGTEVPAGKLDPHAGWEREDDTTVHADPESGLYHTPDSPGYKLGPDGQVFESEEDARNAGFTRWDQPG